MIDDATSRLFARFVRHDSTEENMRLLWSYLEKFGRPLSFYTDQASYFQTAEKRKRDEPGVEKDSLAVRYGERYLPVEECVVADKPKPAPVKAAKTHRSGKRGSDWNKNFDLHKAPKVWQAAQAQGHRKAAEPS
jgi:hypothetical protein